MINLYDTIKGDIKFNQLSVDDLLFAQYICPLPDEFVKIWSDMGYFVHVLSGTKTWYIQDDVWRAEAGQTLFF